MSGIMASVDQRTQLAGRNRMELLLFHMNTAQRFGINVFKVREVIPTPRLVKVPHAHPSVRGIAHIRGQTISVLDLSLATTGRPLQDIAETSVIVTEYNRTVQGFLVSGVDRIVNINWKEVLPPPNQAAAAAYLTAVAKVEGRMVQIIDVEKILAEVNKAGGTDPEMLYSGGVEASEHAGGKSVLLVDDSVVARNQMKRTMEKIGLEVHLANDGEAALEMLQDWADGEDSPLQRTPIVVSDIEMPRMDGYTLTTAIRNDERLSHLFILLHTSLSGVFNIDMVRQVGADDFLAKFHPAELAEKVVGLMERGEAVHEVD
ncbi:chemotaxis protein CheV [Ectothiorhodospiraceae bacterium WFHF3C12]|nr:chemotaxis protein CheV [Ectothiorhodospiraceae bacterium WFHF3C12]